MVSRIFDKKYKFLTIFSEETGAYIRTNVLDENGKQTDKEPFMASFPHLIDVGVMGRCDHGQKGLCAKAGIECYQSGLTIQEPNMSLEDFKSIVDQCKGKVHQFALGGRGDPDQHENFEEILKLCKANHIVPNFTSSGLGFTKEIVDLCKKYTGAVAISWYRSDYTINAINMLIDAGIKTNIHYVLGNNSIDEAIERLENGTFPKGINAIIFLLHKPAGLGREENVLKHDDPRVKKIFEIIDKADLPFKVGMDSCTVPGAINNCKTIMEESLDTCEGARFSCYIGANMEMVPCSFDRNGKYAVSLRGMSIEDAWNSEQFENFRYSLRHSCSGCPKRKDCMGGCPLMPQVVLCNNKEKDLKNEERKDV